jgi:hypothetical protein
MTESYDDRGEEVDGRASTAGPPRWVKVFGIIALVLVVLVVVMLLVGGNHGPGRHVGNGTDRHASSSNVDQAGAGAGREPPAGVRTR